MNTPEYLDSVLDDGQISDYLCVGKGEFLVLSSMQQVFLTRRARKAARRRDCGERHSLCANCGYLRRIISLDLLKHVADAEFTLPAPLTFQQAKRWTRVPRTVP